MHASNCLPEKTCHFVPFMAPSPRQSFLDEFVTLQHHRQVSGAADKIHNQSFDVEAPATTTGKDLINGSLVPIHLKFVDVRCNVQLKATAGALCFPRRKASRVHKEILHGLSGDVEPGEILAMLGPSGSGKTTLLNLLSGRVRTNYSGTVTYNDMAYTKALKRRMGFVTQDDVLFIHLTVKETLRYAALLRLPNQLTREQKVERADSIMRELGLEKCQDTIIGGALKRGVSGGERKRVCIGQEILINPSILFLDEPTSGLDSTTALRILQVIQELAQAGRTVVTTIHQPSSRLYHMFDKLILLSEGQSVYFGKGDAALDYFSSIGLNSTLLMNPADFLLDLANGNINDTSVPPELESRLKSANTSSQSVVQQYLVECFKTRSEQARENTFLPASTRSREGKIGAGDRRWVITWWQQFRVLLSRGFKERRHEQLNWLRIVQVTLSAVISGLMWWQSRVNTERNLQDQVGLIFFMAMFWGYLPVFTAIYTFPQERAMLAKERASDMYRLSSYFMSRTLGDLPLNLALPFFFTVILYFMAHLKFTLVAFLLTILSIFIIVITAEGLGLFIGAVVMDTKHATTVGSITLLIFMLASGFFTHALARFVGWIKYLSYTYYGFRLLIKAQFSSSQVYDCHSETGCKRVDSSSALHGIDLSRASEDVLYLILMVVAYRLLAYLALKRVH